MYNVWMNREENKIYHVIASVKNKNDAEENILISREGIVNSISRKEFEKKFNKTKFSTNIRSLNTPYLKSFKFKSLDDYSEFIMEISDSSEE
ncbi:hypothetical protein [Cetobacterium sp.]|uniref:hypothetical protein n=1 Tax=Cetobacterium sp. TaxID=2071632 RepID=UPI003F2FECB5